MFKMMAASQKLPLHVKAWMGIMALTFGAHVFFLDSQLHQISFGVFLITLAVFAPLSFALTKNINVLAATHFIAWPVALANGVYQVFYLGGVDLTANAGMVLLAGYGVFLVSLILDYRILLKELTIAQQARIPNQTSPSAMSILGATV